MTQGLTIPAHDPGQSRLAAAGLALVAACSFVSGLMNQASSPPRPDFPAGGPGAPHPSSAPAPERQPRRSPRRPSCAQPADLPAAPVAAPSPGRIRQPLLPQHRFADRRNLRPPPGQRRFRPRRPRRPDASRMRRPPAAAPPGVSAPAPGIAPAADAAPTAHHLTDSSPPRRRWNPAHEPRISAPAIGDHTPGPAIPGARPSCATSPLAALALAAAGGWKYPNARPDHRRSDRRWTLPSRRSADAAQRRGQLHRPRPHPPGDDRLRS